ncbi:DUF4962 domain-containing protein, partial [bacterium]|nr:DUF4962 domain-containing protein [bacterium]
KLNLLAKKKKAPEVWELVVKSADEYLKGLRDAEGIKRGRKYYETASTIAGALSWYLEGNEAHKEESIKWIVEHCKVDIWGTGYGTNVDLVASHYLYNLSLAFDILYDEISDDDKKIIINGLKEHANAVYGHVKEMCKEDVRWDQNHFYIPAIALFTTGLVLLDEVPEAEEWVRYTYTGMQRSRYVLGDDGYYYEGTAYWVYAYHWHLRYADLLKRATGESAHNLPIFRKNYLFALHSHFPDRSGSFNIGDGGGSKGNPSILYGFADIFNDGKSQLAAKRRDGNISLTHPATDAASHFLWYNPDVEQASIDDIKPYRHFKDHDILFWRSSWDEDATACVFKCGPSVGHKAAGKLKEMTDWYTNDGHTHPDIGMFWLFARGKYLAIDTGYLYSKRSLDHNTLLIDGKGMANDGSYWVYRERDYDKFDAANIEETYLDKKFAYVRGDFSEVYTDIPGSFKIKRHLMISRDY